MREISYDEALSQVTMANQTIPDSVADVAARLSPSHRAVFPYILDLWKRLNFVDLRPFAAYLCETLVSGGNDLNVIREVTRAGTVLDMGCGWGGFTAMLHNEGYRVTSFDHVYEHAVVTKFATPEAIVFQADARELPLLADETFDFVCMKDLIEHIGDYSQPSGRSGRNIHHQYRALRAAARVAKTGAGLFVTTGNFAFPFDDEVKRWFFHWLPSDQRQKYMDACQFSSDHYFLLTWEEICFLLEASGLDLINTTPRAEVRQFGRILDTLDKTFVDPPVEQALKDILNDLCSTDPRYFPTWRIALRKTTHRPRMPHHNLPLALRVLGGHSDSLENGLQAIQHLLHALITGEGSP